MHVSHTDASDGGYEARDRGRMEGDLLTVLLWIKPLTLFTKVID